MIGKKEMAVWFRELLYVRNNVQWRPGLLAHGLLAPPPAAPFPGKRRGGLWGRLAPMASVRGRRHDSIPFHDSKRLAERRPESP